MNWKQFCKEAGEFDAASRLPQPPAPESTDDGMCPGCMSNIRGVWLNVGAFRCDNAWHNAAPDCDHHGYLEQWPNGNQYCSGCGTVVGPKPTNPNPPEPRVWTTAEKLEAVTEIDHRYQELRAAELSARAPTELLYHRIAQDAICELTELKRGM